MKSQIATSFLSAWMLFLCASGQAQTALPYYTGFDNATEKAGWTEYQTGVTDGLYHWDYSMFSAFSDPECLRHGYPVGGTEQTDNWFVSPEFDFSSGGMIDSLRYAFSGFGTPVSGDTIGVYLLSGSPDPAAASEVAMLYSFTDSVYINDNVWRRTDPFEIPAVGGHCYIAFRYTTVVNWLEVKFDNLSISGAPLRTDQAVTGRGAVQVYPNPSRDFISVKFADDLSVTNLQLVDIQGRVVRSYEADQRVLTLQGLVPGHYLLQIFTEKSILNKKVVVQ